MQKAVPGQVATIGLTDSINLYSKLVVPVGN
jgi:hypothetical protein